jgi:hypothetical protein
MGQMFDDKFKQYEIDTLSEKRRTSLSRSKSKLGSTVGYLSTLIDPSGPVFTAASKLSASPRGSPAAFRRSTANRCEVQAHLGSQGLGVAAAK